MCVFFVSLPLPGLSHAIDARRTFTPPRRHRRAGLSCSGARKRRRRDGEAVEGRGKRTGDGEAATAARRRARRLDSDEAEMGNRARDADGDRRVLGGGPAATAAGARVGVRDSMGVEGDEPLVVRRLFGFGCFTGSGFWFSWLLPATGSLGRRWRPLHSVAASAAFARPSFDLRSVCGPEFTEPGFADGRFRSQGTEESSLSCTAGDHISRGFNPLNRRSCSVGRAPDCLRQNGRLEVLLHRSVGLRICGLLPVRSGYA